MRSRVTWLLLAAVVLGLAGYAVGQAARRGPGLALASGWKMLLAFGLPWLAIAWHEFGHVAGGWLAGQRLLLFAAGPLRLDRRGDRLACSFNRTLSLWGGVASTAPIHVPADREDLRRQMLLMVAGGPLASLLGGLLLVVAWLVPPSPLRLALLVVGGTSLLQAVVTLLPIQNGGFANDGLRLLQMLRRQPEGDRWIAGALLGSLSLTQRPREWPASLVEQGTSGPRDTFDGVMAAWMRHNWHLDRNETDAARHWLETALQHLDALPVSARPLIEAAAAYFFARVDHDVPRAQQHWARVSEPGLLPPDALALAEAAVLSAQGDHAGAQAAVQRARHGLDGLSGSAREWLAETLAGIMAERVVD